jgi:hypothetical protein
VAELRSVIGEEPERSAGGRYLLFRL